MNKGFTIIELLVASLLLGMLVTILTMIFNQSSIAWRTGIANVSDMKTVRTSMSLWQEDADNVFICNNNDAHLILSPWDTSGTGNALREIRACDADGELDVNGTTGGLFNGEFSSAKDDGLDLSNVTWQYGVGSAASGNNANNYMVNVMSAGPDRKFDTWDDIWSSPDDFD